MNDHAGDVIAAGQVEHEIRQGLFHDRGQAAGTRLRSLARAAMARSARA